MNDKQTVLYKNLNKHLKTKAGIEILNIFEKENSNLKEIKETLLTSEWIFLCDNKDIYSIVQRSKVNNRTFLGYYTLLEHRNNGYASYLLKEVVKETLRNENNEICIFIKPDNEISKHIAKKVGFSYKEIYKDICVFSMRKKKNVYTKIFQHSEQSKYNYSV